MDCISEVASVVYAESRGEGEQGMRAVIHVILNRSKEQGVKPCIIVKQPNQFAKGTNNRNDPTWKHIRRLILEPGEDITKGATYFHNLSVKPKWSYRLRVTYKFGAHIFYKPKN